MNSIDTAFVQAHAAAFEDFWNRQLGDSFFETRFPAFGYDVVFQTNAREMLEAAALSAPRYCLSNALEPKPQMRVRMMVVTNWHAPSPPADLASQLQTIAYGELMMQAATPWLQCVINPAARTVDAFLAPVLAAETRMVSRALIDRAITNILIREPVGLLHATSLVRDNLALLIVAPHGTGKSTTAFHLLNAGYRLLGDGNVYLRARGEALELMAYPVGEGKLTPETKALFPQWRGNGYEVIAHNVVKTIVSLRDLAPDKLIDRAIFPERIALFLAERNGAPETHAERLAPHAALERLLPDTMHWDEPARMARSLDLVRRLIERAQVYRLVIGSDRAELVRTLRALAKNQVKVQ